MAEFARVLQAARAGDKDAQRVVSVSRILHTPLGFLGKEMAEAEEFFRSRYGAWGEVTPDLNCEECGLTPELAALAFRMIHGERRL